MATSDHKSTLAIVPAIAGTACVAGAIGLLISDGIATGHYTVTHALQPVLVAGTICAAVWAHRSLASWRPVSALAFIALALLGSVATIYGTLGRQADARDAKVSMAMAENRQLANKDEDLAAARAAAKVECKSGFGIKCTNATTRVDSLVASMASLRAVSTDPRADAIADLFHLVASVDKQHTKEVVGAIDPLVLPLFLELGSILFFAVAFPTRKVRQELNVAGENEESVEVCQRTWTRAEILADLRRMKQVGAQRFLATRYNVSEGHISKLMKSFELAGHISRQRDGQSKAIAIVAPERKRLGHMAKAS